MASSSLGTTPRSTFSATACTTAPASSRASAPTRPSSGTAVFRHREHLERLHKSAELYYLPMPYSRRGAARGDPRADPPQRARSCYIRPLAFRGYGEMGLFAKGSPIEVTIAIWPWGAYLGEEGKQNGIRAKVSSWRRISPDSLIPHAKASGQYLNSILAKTESRQRRLRRGDPARRRAAWSARARARTSSSSARARS